MSAGHALVRGPDAPVADRLGLHLPLTAGPIAAPVLARLVAFAPLALFGLAHWARLVEPGAGLPALGAVVLATTAGAALAALPPRAGRAARAAGIAGVVLALVLGTLVAAGTPLRLLWPDAWDELAAGLGQGIGSLAGVNVPYRGVDPWTRSAVVGGGVALAALAAAVAFWPARREGQRPGFPLAGAAALGALYTIPVVERGPDQPFLGGFVFCVLLAAFLWLERLRSDQLGVGAACLLLAAVGGALAAPRLDAGRPWFDYEGFAERFEPTRATGFRWDHGYGPLNWPREGREVLRVKARSQSYWKAVNLDRFDGRIWKASGRLPSQQRDSELARGRREWFQTIRVVDRGLSSREFVTAGTTLAILAPSPRPVVEYAPSAFASATRPLRPGNSYEARVYTPKPTQAELRSGRSDPYPSFTTEDYLSVDVPLRPGAEKPADPTGGALLTNSATVRFEPYGQPADALVVFPDGFVERVGRRVLADSPYRRAFNLARDLAAGSSSAYDFAVKVRQRVQEGAAYTENTARHPYPLDAFLFDDRQGYCQQFSGAMALLLRMGGVPARVASGFSPGRLNRSRGEYVVRDLDAHSWVEAYFPRFGWVTFDPTPASSPAASRSGAPGFPSAPPNTPAPAPGDRPADAVGDTAATGDGGLDRTLAAVALVLLLAAGAAALLLRRRGRLPVQPLAPELAELQVALHRSGRTPAPDMTLARLEQVLGGTDAARAYVRALRDRRFREDGRAPTIAQRRALRTELAAGLGAVGRLRAWWALPPRRPRLRSHRPSSVS